MKKIAIIILATLMIFKIDAQNGLKTIEHRVEKGQTLYFLSKKYDVSVQDIMRFNPQIGKDMIVKEGMIVKIYTKPRANLNVYNYKYHTVEKGQTLYSLSKMYNISVDDLIFLNQLENPSIGIGDKLIVQNIDEDALFDASKVKDPAIDNIPKDNVTIKAKDPVKEIKPTILEGNQADKGTAAASTDKDVQMYKMLYESYAESGAAQNKAKGIGNFLEQSSSKDVYLALVNGVENGQVIRVRNLMNNKVIYLKVIGSVPQKDEASNISIKLSKAAARDLKIVEDRFLAEWTWYKKTAETTEPKKAKGSIVISDF